VTGFVVGVTNPKTIVFFAAALPEFTDRAAGHPPLQAQMLIIGALFPAVALVLDSAWAAAAGTARQWLARSPRRPDADRRHWRPGDDRARRQHRGSRPQGLIEHDRVRRASLRPTPSRPI
jgi:hypothetical protein